MCPMCSGPIKVGDRVRAVSFANSVHESCWLKDRELWIMPDGSIAVQDSLPFGELDAEDTLGVVGGTVTG